MYSNNSNDSLYSQGNSNQATNSDSKKKQLKRQEDIHNGNYLKKHIGHMVNVNYCDSVNRMIQLSGVLEGCNKYAGIAIASEGSCDFLPLSSAVKSIREVVLEESGEQLYINEKIRPFWNPFNQSYMENGEVVQDLDIDLMLNMDSLVKNGQFGQD